MQPEAGTIERTLKAAQRGDVGAFNTLALSYHRQLFNVCYRMLGNPEDAADATQDALIAAFRGLRSFNGAPAGLRAWLLRIAINTCYDHLRRRQRRAADSLDAMDADDPERDSSTGQRLADPRIGPEQQSLNAETAHQIQTAIECLPPDQRLTVILCDVQGFSYDEAAQIMAIELGTVKSRLSRARAQLRELLMQKGELPASAQRLHERNP